MPFLALRSYLPAGHESKHAEIGSERNPAEFIDMLLNLTAEWGRVLAPHGSIAIELGDTYSGDDRRNGEVVDAKTPHRMTVGRPQSGRANTGQHWPRAKSLALIPQLYAVALAYGINPLTGQPSPAGRWLVRNVVVWHRPNPAVGALGDKVRPSTSYIVVATRSPKRWFDLTAVRMPLHGNAMNTPDATADGKVNNRWENRHNTHAGAPPLDAWFDPYDGTHDTWTLTTQPSSLPHYACVDDQTQALTRNGWKYHHELRDGDAIAAYNSDAKTISWQAATFHRYDYDGDLVAIDKRTTSQRLTPNHRVLVSDRHGKEKVVLAEDLKPGHQVPLAAPFNDNRTPTIGAALMELIGWYITEGTERLHTVDIYQSVTVNEGNCKRIAWLLDKVGATYTVSDRHRNTLSAHIDWTERRWTISGHVAAVLKDLAPAKRLTADIVFRSSHSELHALLDGLIGGDGHTRANGRRSFIQQSPETMDMVQALCCRLGIRSTIGQGNKALHLTLGSRTATTLRGTNGKHEPIGREYYTGIVWCPSVPSTFWLARRNGRPFITGNTWPAKLAERLILMMCPREVCRICGEPRRRVEGSGSLAAFQPILAEAIRAARTSKGLTAREVNEWFGPSKSNWVGHWEDTKSQPVIPTPVQWAILRTRLDLDPILDDFVVPRSTVEYSTANGDVLEIGDRRTKYDRGGIPQFGNDIKASRSTPTGWTDCGHDTYRPGLTLDPFVGSGTTCCTAELLGRDSIGIDLDPRNREIFPRRMEEVKRALFGTKPELPNQLGMFDEVPT